MLSVEPQVDNGNSGLIVVSDELHEKVFEFVPGAMHAVRQPLLAENAKEALDTNCEEVKARLNCPCRHQSTLAG
jgi:hypothetical protein